MTTLQIGGGADLVRRHEEVRLGRGTARLLYASDLHLGWPWTRRVPEQVVAAVRDLAPDALLLGGDLIDGRRALAALESLVREASRHTLVGAIPGNHDVAFGAARVAEAVVRGGGTWLPANALGAGTVTVHGSIRRPPGASGVRVLCAHRPHVLPTARKAEFDVVLAGHLHGGQIVTHERGGLLYPYAWIDRMNGLRFPGEETTMLVSRGAGDVIPFRWRCPREVLVCDLL